MTRADCEAVGAFLDECEAEMKAREGEERA
jgi:hypothetical protein